MNEPPVIVYFHGFASSGASGTAQLLRRRFREARVLSPDIPLDPAEALPFLKRFCAEHAADLIVGSSMGGMYAQQMRGFRRICANPAFHLSRLYDILKPGRFPWMNRRENGEKEGKVTKEIVARFRAMEERQFDGITPADRELCWGIFGRRDERVHGYDEFVSHYPHAEWFDGPHRLNDTVIDEVVVPLARRLLAAAAGAAAGGE
jgi:predicted esterase YcpF (UPF0227 family)